MDRTLKLCIETQRRRPGWERAGLICLIIGGFLLGCDGSNPASRLIHQGWVPLYDGSTLSNWTITSFGGEGRVRVSEGSILLPFGETLTGITYEGDFPRSSYEVRLEAQRIKGNDFFCALTFPVQKSYCSLIIGGWGGSIVGLSSIDGLDASENETTLVRHFDNLRWYGIRLLVSNQRIEAWIDNEPVVNLELEGVHLGIRPEVRLSRPFGIASWQTTAALKDIYLRDLNRESQ